MVRFAGASCTEPQVMRGCAGGKRELGRWRLFWWLPRRSCSVRALVYMGCKQYKDSKRYVSVVTQNHCALEYTTFSQRPVKLWSQPSEDQGKGSRQKLMDVDVGPEPPCATSTKTRIL